MPASTARRAAARKSATIAGIVDAQGTWHGQRLLARGRVRDRVRRDRRQRDRLDTADLGVRHPADDTQLDEHLAALGVHGLRDLGPPAFVAVGVHARRVFQVGAVGGRDTAVASE